MIRSSVLTASLFATAGAMAQAPAAAPSPAELALGTDIAAKLLPNGTYERIMGGGLAQMMGGYTSQALDAPLAPFLKAAGVSDGDKSKLGKATLKQIMDIVDPAYEQRTQAMMPIMMREMGKVMTQIEPAMRDGLAQAYARHFTAQQLQDIDRFLNTPSGNAFAAQNMTIASDPAVMQKMQAFMPTLIQALPGIMQKAMAATADLPKPRTPDMLTAADREKLAQLLGTPSDRFAKPPAAPLDAPTRKLSPDLEPAPVGNMGQLFGPANYPPAAMRAESEGRVVAAVGVDPSGNPVSCTVQETSGSGVLDAETCSIAVNQMRFNPATDRKAHPIAGTYKLAVRWVLPTDVPAATAKVPITAAPTH